MRLAGLRGIVAFALTIGAISFAWSTIENRPESIEAVGTTTTTTTTTTVAPPTTTTPEQATQEICQRSSDFASLVEALPNNAGPGPTAQLAAAYWSKVMDLSAPQLRTEVVAVVAYYDDYLALASPFGFSASKIIVDGDKEKFQQLVTRPAPGLATARGVIAFACGVEVPDQPWMSAKAFIELENKLLFPDEDEES